MGAEAAGAGVAGADVAGMGDKVIVVGIPVAKAMFELAAVWHKLR